MDMVRQDYNGIYTIIIPFLTQSKGMAKQVNIIYQQRIASLCYHGDKIAITISKYSSIIHRYIVS